MPIHFGVKVLPGKKGLELSRENYALINNRSSIFSESSYEKEVSLGIFNPDREVSVNGNIVKLYKDNRGQFYTDEWCREYQKECLLNFDLHMELFSSLDRTEFNNEVANFTKEFKEFSEISDLNVLNGKSGYYVMVLDKYCQVYIGTSSDIMKRIRQHWSQSKQFDRLLFPMGAVYKSIMSIGSFRAYDTTRIFAYQTNKTYTTENKYISYFSPEFCTNRVSGGLPNGGLFEMISSIKSRNLQK